MSQIVEKIQKASVRTLNAMVVEALGGAERGVVDQIGGFLALREKTDNVLITFVTNMNICFDKLLDKEVIKEDAVFDFETLSLVQEEDLEVMVNASRNEHLPNFISFNTRLNSLFPRKRIDETTNPLDPEQIATSFQEALRPIGMDAQNSLAVYRAFNKKVLRHLDTVLKEANKILIDSGVIPDLGIESSKKKDSAAVRANRRRDPTSAFGTVEEEEVDEDIERPELFSMMQNLMHADEPAPPTSAASAGAGTQPTAAAGGTVIPEGHVVVPADQVQQYMVPAALASADGGDATTGVMQPFQPTADQQVQMVDQAKLMEILNNIQHSLDANAGSAIPKSIEDVERINISESLGEILSTPEEEGVVNAVDRQSSDVINLVTLLYEAIWDDESVPIPIKELIGRTQITIIKVALSDNTFFNRENHPARAILNEFAAAGIGWTEVEKLEEDPLYKKIQELVEKILTEYGDDISFFEDLIKDFRNFKTKEAAKAHHLEQSILKANERQERVDDIHELVKQKIDERILGRELHPFVTELLENPFHKFMVMLELKEGPGTNAWKQSVNTIDVLLWSVQPHEQPGDRDRLETVNPRLLNNLRKAFRIASVESDEVDSLIIQLKEVQEESFGEPEEPEQEDVEVDLILPLSEAASMVPAAESEEQQTTDPSFDLEVKADDAQDLSASISPIEAKETIEIEEEKAEDGEEEEDYGPFMEQIEAMTVGIWVEFIGEDDQNTRCKLAAKINAIDKFIFVNREGVKVVEKTTVGLAKELKEGSVRIISDGLLFSRALESVIGNLRDSQHEQQTGGAYQPTA
ncbi:MAG: hypothetical protein CMQ20_09875 [Gammaproteobacteria bacterium]|nr:hypothetical protein [Gammaproteobacteria bacterium]